MSFPLDMIALVLEREGKKEEEKKMFNKEDAVRNATTKNNESKRESE